MTNTLTYSQRLAQIKKEIEEWKEDIHQMGYGQGVRIAIAKLEGLKEGYALAQKDIVEKIDNFALECDVDGRKIFYDFTDHDLRELKESVGDKK